MSLKSLREAAEIWSVSVHTVRRLADVGLVETVRVGRRRLISESEIERIIATGVPSPQAYAAACKWLPRCGESVE
jgi:excisionase family DNA binding protein